MINLHSTPSLSNNLNSADVSPVRVNIPVSNALELIDAFKPEISSPELIQQITTARTKLLHLQESWVQFVSGAIEVMMLHWLSRPSSMPKITEILTSDFAANDEKYALAA